MTNLWNIYEKADLRKIYDERVYENVTLAASDVIPEAVCRWLLLVKYFELK